MKNFTSCILLLTCLSWIAACTNAPSKEDEANLKAAMEYHEKAIAVEKQVSQHLKKMAEDTTAMVTPDQLESWKQSYADWKEALVEVPGMEHDHHHHDHEGDGHDHEHHHHHAPIPDLTPAQHKSVQQELLTTIERLLKSIEDNL